MSDNTNSSIPIENTASDLGIVPVIPDSVPRSLSDWFSSDEFQNRLTYGFWEAKRLALEARDQNDSRARSS
jgi:hypothetical protein